MRTGMSTTVSMNCNWGNLYSLQENWPLREVELEELLELVQHGHRDVHHVNLAQYLYTTLGWR